MKADLMQFSVVIAGNVHNPSLLNPDFLTVRRIVPEDWGWKILEPVIVTPPIATVRYSSGVSITVEHNKLQIVDVGSERVPSKSKALDIARGYVKTLPHIRYTAVGANFQSVVDVTAPESFLMDRFLKPGTWNSSPHPLNALGLRLVYSLEGGRIVLSLDSGLAESVVEGKKSSRPVIAANANFHREWPEVYPADQNVLNCLDKIVMDFTKYNSLLGATLGLDKG